MEMMRVISLNGNHKCIAHDEYIKCRVRFKLTYVQCMMQLYVGIEVTLPVYADIYTVYGGCDLQYM